MSNAGELYISASVDQQQTEDTKPNERQIAWRDAVVSVVGLSVLLAGCGGEKDEQATDKPAAAAEATPTRSKIIFPSDNPRPEETNHQVPDSTDDKPQSTKAPRPTSVRTFEDNGWYSQSLENYKKQPGVFNESDAVAALREHGYKPHTFGDIDVTPAHVLNSSGTLITKNDQFDASGVLKPEDVKGLKKDCRVDLMGERVDPKGDVNVTYLIVRTPDDRSTNVQMSAPRIDLKKVQKDKRVIDTCNNL